MKLIKTNKLVDFFLQFIIYNQFRITIINQSAALSVWFCLVSIINGFNSVVWKHGKGSDGYRLLSCLLRGIKVY